jgi:DNA-binding IclR family transcriptional regulator
MSSEEQIPQEVRELIQEHIHSIEALEVLLFLFQRHDRWLSMVDIARELRIGDSSVQAAVADLTTHGFVERDTTAAQYRVGTTHKDRSVAALLHTYEHARVETLVMISRNAIGRVRNDALKIFAEAFRLGGRKKDG